MMKQILNEQELHLLDKWWRASNYLSVGQLYLLDNPLLETPLTRDQIKRKIVGHWYFTQELTGFRRADRKIRIVKIRGAELLFHLLNVI